MKLSPLYLEQISQAEQRGELRGELKGELRGEKMGKAEMVITLLNYRLGSLDPALEKQIYDLSNERIEALGKALLDFREAGELVAWLEN